MISYILADPIQRREILNYFTNRKAARQRVFQECRSDIKEGRLVTGINVNL